MEVLAGIDIPLWWILLPLTCLLVYLYATWPFNQFQQLGISGPPPKPFFGNQREISSRGMMACILDWGKKYGRVYGVYLGRRPLLVINDLDILKTVLVKDFANFTDRWQPSPKAIGKPFSDSVLRAKGADWKRIRNIITPTFSAGKLKLMEPYINRCSQVLTENLLQQAQQGNQVPVKEYFGAFTLDVITGTAFGLQVNSQKDLNDRFLASLKSILSRNPRTKFFNLIQGLMPFLAPVVNLIRTVPVLSDGQLSFLLNSIDSMIKQRKSESGQSRSVDFLDLLIKAQAKEETESPLKHMTTDEVKGQIVIFFLAGYETTATTLNFLTYHLTMYPDVQQRVVEEIEKELGQEMPNYENVSKLKYLEQAIQETLRLFPPASMVTRETAQTTTIKDVTIPKGFGVVVPICEVMRDPNNFPEPELFNPDRFSDKAAVDPITFLPFGFGPRLCIGMRLAMMEIKIAMVHVLRKLKFVRTPDLPEKLCTKPAVGSLLSTDTLMIKAVPRETDQ